MSRVAIAEFRPPRRISNIMTRLSAEAEARMCSLCGAQATEGMAASCPGSECVESPDLRSKSLTDRADVPTAINSVDAGCAENEWEYGVDSRENVWTGVMEDSLIEESLRVVSWEVVMIVDGVGSNG